MGMEEIIVEISPKNETKITVNGVKGSGCKDLTRGLEKALGKTIVDKETSEMYEPPTVQRINQ